MPVMPLIWCQLMFCSLNAHPALSQAQPEGVSFASASVFRGSDTPDQPKSHKSNTENALRARAVQAYLEEARLHVSPSLAKGDFF